MSIQESIQRAARETMAHQRWASFAIVQQVDTKRNRAKVRLMPEGEMTGFLRISPIAAGNGWTAHFPIFKDDEVLVVFPNGKLTSGVITLRLHQEIDRWPNDEKYTADPARKFKWKDFYLLHESGSFMRMFGEKSDNTKNGRGQAHEAGDIMFRARGHGNFRVEADTRVELVAPDVYLRSHDGKSNIVLSDWVDYWNNEFLPKYHAHIHPGVMSGFSTTAPTLNGIMPPLLKDRVCDMHTFAPVGR